MDAPPNAYEVVGHHPTRYKYTLYKCDPLLPSAPMVYTCHFLVGHADGIHWRTNAEHMLLAYPHKCSSYGRLFMRSGSSGNRIESP